jgi:hypothetical protein
MQLQVWYGQTYRETHWRHWRTLPQDNVTAVYVEDRHRGEWVRLPTWRHLWIEEAPHGQPRFVGFRVGMLGLRTGWVRQWHPTGGWSHGMAGLRQLARINIAECLHAPGTEAERWQMPPSWLQRVLGGE